MPANNFSLPYLSQLALVETKWFLLKLGLFLAGRRSLDAKDWLRSQLVRFPFWARGQLEFAKHSVLHSDLAHAYSGALAVLELSKNPKLCARAKHILGKCFLGKSDLDQALINLEAALKYLPESWDLREDLAACYMAQKKFAEAHSQLVAVPDGLLSPSAVAVLVFLESKLRGENESAT